MRARVYVCGAVVFALWREVSRMRSGGHYVAEQAQSARGKCECGGRALARHIDTQELD